MQAFSLHIIRLGTRLLLCGFFSLLSVQAMAQGQPLEKKISLSLDQVSLPEALEQVSKRSGVQFSYSTRLVKAEYKVTIDVTGEEVSEVLKLMLEPFDLEILEVEDHLVIKHTSPGEDQPDEEREDPEQFVLSGYITDHSTGEHLIGATVYINELAEGAVSNAYGFYSLKLDKGSYTAGYSYVGYQSHSYPVQLFGDLKQDIGLQPESSMLNEVTIEMNEFDLAFDRIQTSEVNLEPSALQQMPSFLGENDLIKSLQGVPGISLFGDGSTLFYVRGGNRDQNQILIDEAPIYNPAHLLGFFSTLVPEAINDITIYKGDFPAAYGGRLSSLLDIKTREGNMKQFGVHASIGLIAAKLSLEGPIVRDKSSYFIAARRSYFKWALKLLNPGISELYFSDLNAKVNVKLNEKNRLYLSTYLGRDFFSMEESASNSIGINWENAAATLRWNHLFSDRLFANTTLYASKYDYFLVTNVSRNDAWNAHVANATLKSDFSYYLNPSNTIRFGGLLSTHNFNPGNFQFGDDSRVPWLPVISKRNARETALYISNEQSLGDRLSIRYGLRMNIWSNFGEATEYRFDEQHNVVDTNVYAPGEAYHQYAGLEPRIGLSYRLSPTTSMKGGYSRTNQYLQLITNSISPFTTLEVWLPAGPNIKPQVADQFTLGYFRKSDDASWVFSMETYYKMMREQTDYADHAQMILNPLVEAELRFGETRAYGLETQVKKNGGRLTGWLAYTLSRAIRSTPGINFNQEYPAAWDRPHELSIYLSCKASRRWSLSGNWMLMSGSAFSSPTGFYQYNGHTVPVYHEKNNDRYPAYHRLDLTANWLLNKKETRFKHYINFSIYNVYGRKNPFSVNFSKIEVSETDYRIPGDLYHQPYIIPTQMYLFGFVPSITYNLSF